MMGLKRYLAAVLLGTFAALIASGQEVQSRELGEPGEETQPRESQTDTAKQNEQEAEQPAEQPATPSDRPAPKTSNSQSSNAPSRSVAAFWFILPER